MGTTSTRELSAGGCLWQAFAGELGELN